MGLLDCVVAACSYQMEGRDDEELFLSAREHADEAHPDKNFTDEQIREVIRTKGYETAA